MQRRTRWALGVVAVVMAAVGLAGLATSGTVEAPSGAVTVHYVEAFGVPFCSCVPMRDGCYTAKHCFTPMPPLYALTVDGVKVPGVGLDPNRDLAHIPLFADASVEYGEPADASWYGMRHGTARYLRSTDVQGPYHWPNGTYTDRQRYDTWCYARSNPWGLPGIPSLGEGERPIKPGDSGGGFYVGGRLVGILSLYDPSGCSAWTVRVP